MNSDNVPLLGTRPSIAPRPRTLRVPRAPETPLEKISPAEAASLTTTRLPTIFPTHTGGAPIDSGLAAADAAFEARLAEIRAHPDLQPPLGTAEREALLYRLDAYRQLVHRQLAIEGLLRGSGGR